MFIDVHRKSSSDTCYSKTEKHDETLRASPNIEFVEPSEVRRGEGCDQDIKCYDECSIYYYEIAVPLPVQ